MDKCKTQLDFHEAWEMLPAAGWLDKEEAKLLWDVARMTAITHPDDPVLEVGCYQGRSTVLLALSAPGRFVYAVDPFDGFDSSLSGNQVNDSFHRNLDSRNICNVLLWRQKIEDWPPLPVIMAYLDGDHTAEGTSSQITKALACTPKYVLIHDVNDDGGGLSVKRAAVAMLGPWKERVGRLALWQMWETHSR